MILGLAPAAIVFNILNFLKFFFVNLLVSFEIIANPSNEVQLYSQITSAEKYYRENQYEQALDELNTILSKHKYSLDSQTATLIADAHLLRGIIYIEIGDLESAITELSLAIRWGNPETKAAANEILVAINFKS